MCCWCQAEHGYQDKSGISSNDEYAEQMAAAKVSKKALGKISGFYQDEVDEAEWPPPEHKAMLEEDVHVCVICDVGSDVLMHVHVCVRMRFVCAVFLVVIYFARHKQQ